MLKYARYAVYMAIIAHWARRIWLKVAAVRHAGSKETKPVQSEPAEPAANHAVLVLAKADHLPAVSAWTIAESTDIIALSVKRSEIKKAMIMHNVSPEWNIWIFRRGMFKCLPRPLLNEVQLRAEGLPDEVARVCAAQVDTKQSH